MAREEPLASILHISDLHFGWPAVPEAAEAVHALAARLRPSAVACSGDLVQRGDFAAQFRQARAFLERFEAPVLVVPGNHDLPLYNPLARLFRPFANFRRYIHPELEPVLVADGAVLVGISTPRPWLIDLGYVGRRQLERVAEAFAAAPPEALRVVVMHHPLVPTRRDGLFRHHVRGSRRAVRALAAAGAELVLSGHNHFPHCERVHDAGAVPLLVVHSGTACSSRVRPHTGCDVNAVNVIRREPDGTVAVEHHHFRDGEFRAVAVARFARAARS
ncbi:MAG: DNA repair exonuclease [Planctomycetota bacterium]|nr:MAG: DNA repair exonuclease [Planctomycetota bacterium]